MYIYGVVNTCVECIRGEVLTQQLIVSGNLSDKEVWAKKLLSFMIMSWDWGLATKTI